MRKTKMILTLVLCLLLTLALFGCNTPEPSVTEPTPPPTSATPTEPPLSDQYIQAAAPLRNAKNLVVELTSKKTITTEAGVFNWVSEQDLTLTNIGTDTFSASLTENLEPDGLSDEYTEYYANEKLYVNVADSDFRNALCIYKLGVNKLAKRQRSQNYYFSCSVVSFYIRGRICFGISLCLCFL